MGRDDTVIAVKNEREAFIMSAAGAGRGCEWLRWRRRWRDRFRYRSSSSNGLAGGGDGGGGVLTGLPLWFLLPRLRGAGNDVYWDYRPF